MKIDFSTQVKVGDTPVFLEKDKPADLGHICRDALNFPPQNKRLSLEDLVARGRLAEQISSGAVVDVKPEDISLIRSCLPDRYQHAQLVVTVYDLLDPR